MSKLKLKTHKQAAKRFKITGNREDHADQGHEEPLSPPQISACEACVR